MTRKSWVVIGPMIVFGVAAVLAQRHDGGQLMPALGSGALLLAVVIMSYGLFVASKARERRRHR